MLFHGIRLSQCAGPPLETLESDHRDLAVFIYEDAGPAGAKILNTAAKVALNAKLNEEGFKAGAKEICRVDLEILGKQRRVFAIGLGKKKAATGETFRRAAGALVGAIRSKREKVAVLCAEQPQAVAEGLILASYKYEEYKKGDADKLASAALVVQDAGSRGAIEKACAKASLYAEAVALARDLVNRAPSDKTPASLAALAETFKGLGVSVTVIDKDEAEKLGMGSFLGVARGSAQPPVMVHMVYKPKGAKKKVALVGKGVTFDSGGLSLKPAQSMEEMKCDMAGAASVISVFKVIARLKPKAEVHGIFAATYNMPGPDAYKPGDVLKAMNGKTIEVWNTDAEGRLILADALCLAAQQQPQAIVDLATLTGAVVIALGSKVAGIMGNDRRLVAAVKSAGARANEDFCELPLVEDYKDSIKGNIAELLNISKVRGEAGSIIGGLFLQEFVGETPWVHLDIAGTAFWSGDGPYGPKGGTGSPVRTLLEWLGGL
ncbi:MAG: leucyl aminopeptidase [Elusimicrobia bacterium]|nr:leucyl aminopeptidase [Elusimicrobiota bacterium]